MSAHETAAEIKALDAEIEHIKSMEADTFQELYEKESAITTAMLKHIEVRMMHANDQQTHIDSLKVACLVSFLSGIVIGMVIF